MLMPLASQIQDMLPRIHDAYYKLVLAVGPPRTGKTATLIELAVQHGWPRFNVNLRLSEQLLDSSLWTASRRQACHNAYNKSNVRKARHLMTDGEVQDRADEQGGRCPQ
jgi:hypothetical protein